MASKTSKKTTDIVDNSQNFDFKSVSNFIDNVKGEMKKISWTEKEELKEYTKVIVGSTFVLGMALYAADLLIKGSLEVLSLLFGGY